MTTQYPVFTDIRVRFRDTDAMGHVNNAVYATYFEMAREAYWVRLDAASTYSHVPFVLAHLSIDFRSPAYQADVIRVHVRTHWIGRRSFAMQYVANEAVRECVIAEAESVQVTYDYKQGRSIDVPDWLRRKIEALEGGPLPGRARPEGSGSTRS